MKRWIRFAIPMGLAAGLIAWTVTAHALNEPDTDEPAYLSPTVAPTDPVSGDGLARLLEQHGTRVQRETHTSDALTAAWAAHGTAVLFIPAPEYVHPDYLEMLGTSPSFVKAVLVEPGQTELRAVAPQIEVAGQRWATEVTSPGSGCPYTTAGQAAVTRTRYQKSLVKGAGAAVTSCYDGGLVGTSQGNAFLLAVGSADPFRSDRLGEHDNAKLALDLLGSGSRVIWLDLHSPEPQPGYDDSLTGTNGQVVPSYGPGRSDKTHPSAKPTQGTGSGPGGGTGDGSGSGSGQGSDQGGAQGGGQSGRQYELAWWWPTLIMLLLAGLALALARGRRLGLPVSEPLPVSVRGAETAIGRGRLYQRARARDRALNTLREDCRQQLARLLRLPATADRETLLPAVAARLGLPEQEVADTLYGPPPENDDELQERAQQLQDLVTRTTHEVRGEGR